MVAKKFKNRCMVCGKRVDKGEIQPHGSAHGLLTLHDDCGEEALNQGLPRVTRKLLLCGHCADDLVWKALEMNREMWDKTDRALEVADELRRELNRMPRGFKPETGPGAG